MKKKILIVVTSFEKYPNLNRPTGLWLGEAVHFVKKVEAAGYAVDYVSPKGGYTPIDPHGLAMADPSDWVSKQTIHEPARGNACAERHQSGRLRRHLLRRRSRRGLGFSR